jgi:6-pyruvoyltetrahydropterin/6-carboxytetrahydropterin synthase
MMQAHPSTAGGYRLELAKTFRFEAAHYLPNFPEGHKCRRLHGHSFEFEVVVEGTTDPHTGVVIDYGDISWVVKPLVEQLDHYCLNDLGAAWNDPLLLNPTSEHLAVWLYEHIKPLLPELSAIIVYETCTSRCVYRGVR